MKVTPLRIKSDLTMPVSAILWLANGDRGLSSNTIFQVITGITCVDEEWHNADIPPADAWDFIRCEKLLTQVPEFREQLHQLQPVSEQWNVLVEHWHILVATLTAEQPEWNTPGVSIRHPELTYRLMKHLETVAEKRKEAKRKTKRKPKATAVAVPPSETLQ